MRKLLFICCLFLIISCNILSTESTFLDEALYNKNKQRLQALGVENYSFECTLVSPYSPATYIVCVQIENSNLVKREYKRIFCDDVSGLSEDEIQVKIDEVKNRQYFSYDDSVDKLCIELSGIDDIYNLIEKIYKDMCTEYESGNGKYNIKTSISYDEDFLYPREFICALSTKSLVAMSDALGCYGVRITNFKQL